MANITKDIQIIDLALYLSKHNILLITDTHIGYEEALNKQGIFMPRFQFGEIIKRLGNILNMTKARNPRQSVQFLNAIIINGDVKHEFGNISEQEWRHTIKLLDFLSKYCKKVILIRGNHDTILGPIAAKKQVDVIDYFTIGGILIMHGDKLNEGLINNKKIHTIIIGHEHPAISLREGLKNEMYKCFLKGKYKNKTLIVQPSFKLVTEGTDVLKEKLLSPLLQRDLSEFEVYIASGNISTEFSSDSIPFNAKKNYPNVLYFGKVGRLRRIMAKS